MLLITGTEDLYEVPTLCQALLRVWHVFLIFQDPYMLGVISVSHYHSYFIDQEAMGQKA